MIRALLLFALLAGCDTVDLGATPADIGQCHPGQKFFVDQVWPNFLNKDYGGKHCNQASCHDGTGTGGALNLRAPATPLTYPMDTEWQQVFQNAAFQMHCSTPQSSPLVEYPDGLLTHGGGMLISQTGPEIDLIVQWVSAP